MNSHFRHEYKISISYAEYLTLKSRLYATIKRDSHSDQSGEYFIRSIYFDNVYDTILREKLDGIKRREKFRIRYYNNDTSFIHLEKKAKINDLCLKESARITRDEAKRIFRGETEWMLKSDRCTVTELYSKMQTLQLRPKSIVDYRREPFVFPAGNVRITFDRDIRTTPFTPDIFEAQDISVSVSPEIILEIKFDGFLPSFISNLIQTGTRQPSAFSKYAASRIYQ